MQGTCTTCLSTCRHAWCQARHPTMHAPYTPSQAVHLNPAGHSPYTPNQAVHINPAAQAPAAAVPLAGTFVVASSLQLQRALLQATGPAESPAGLCWTVAQLPGGLPPLLPKPGGWLHPVCAVFVAASGGPCCAACPAPVLGCCQALLKGLTAAAPGLLQAPAVPNTHRTGVSEIAHQRTTAELFPENQGAVATTAASNSLQRLNAVWLPPTCL